MYIVGSAVNKIFVWVKRLKWWILKQRCKNICTLESSLFDYSVPIRYQLWVFSIAFGISMWLESSSTIFAIEILLRAKKVQDSLIIYLAWILVIGLIDLWCRWTVFWSPLTTLAVNEGKVCQAQLASWHDNSLPGKTLLQGFRKQNLLKLGATMVEPVTFVVTPLIKICKYGRFYYRLWTGTDCW